MHVKTDSASKEYSKIANTPLGYNKKTSSLIENENVACNFICELLQSKGFSKEYSKQVGYHGWQEHSNKQMSCAIRRWLLFCDKERINHFQLNIKNILGFLQTLFVENKSYTVIKAHKIALIEMRKLAGMGMTTTQQNYIQKFLRLCFNLRPPIKGKKYAWDVNVLLDMFKDRWKDNDMIKINRLAGKVILMVMLTSMCRKAEVLHMRISEMTELSDGSLQFRLPTPTKTFNFRTYHRQQKLQFITVPRMAGKEKICPVTGLWCYLERTKVFCKKIDKIFILMQEDSRPAASTMAGRWYREILVEAGITGVGAHSARMAASCGAAVRGLSIDFLISTASWTKTTSFVKHYLKPIRLKENPVKTKEIKQGKGEADEKSRQQGKIREMETHEKGIGSKGQVATLSSTHQKYDSKLVQIKTTVVRKRPSLWSIVEKDDESQVNGLSSQMINKSNESINQGSNTVSINTTGKITPSSKDKITTRGVVGRLNEKSSGVVNKINDKLMTAEIPLKLNMPITPGVNRGQQIVQGSEEDFRGKLNHFKSQSGKLISKTLVIKKPRFCQKSYDKGKSNKLNVPINDGTN